MATLTVVGGAVIDAGRVLAARRSDAPAGTGWEFPGGKVEPGESETQALARELREELSLQVRVGALVGRTALGGERELAVYLADPLHTRPRLGADHDQLHWLAATELHDLAWLDADRALLGPLAALLRAR